MHDPDSGTRPRAEAIAAGPGFTDCENKTTKILKSEFWPISQKFVPAKITNHTMVLEIIRYARFSK